MDPNATLAELRRLVARFDDNGEHDGQRMAELFEALDAWIMRGGFLPEAWAREQIKARGPIVAALDHAPGCAYIAARGICTCSGVR